MPKRGEELGNRWIILRTSGRCTLGLAASLSKAGYEVWTPAQTLTGKKAVAVPITPTFVFARAHRLVDLITLAATPRKPHDDFSVFHYFSRIPAIDDVELEALRTAETKAVPKRNRKPYVAGAAVRIADGAGAGMSGIVEEADGGFAMVNFGGSMRWKIAAFLLRPNLVGTDQPSVDLAA